MRNHTSVHIVVSAALVATLACTDPAEPADELVGPLAAGPPADCVALIGDEPWITLFEGVDITCVLAAEEQNLQIWNKGFQSMTVEWPGGDRTVASDFHFDTGPIGEVLAPGRNEIEAAPFAMPSIWVLPAEMSPTAGLRLVDGSFGGVRPGMTLDEASDVLGVNIVIDANLLPGPRCLGAVVEADPYSPVFAVIGDGDGSGEIATIGEYGPPDPCGR